MNVLQELAFLAAQNSFGDNYSGERKTKPISAERIQNRFVVLHLLMVTIAGIPFMRGAR